MIRISFALQERLRKKKLRAVFILLMFAFVQLGLVYWLISDFVRNTQFLSVCAEIILVTALGLLERRFYVFRSFARLKRGVVVKEQVKNVTVPENASGPLDHYVSEVSVILYIECGRRVRRLCMHRTEDHGVLRVGDEVILSREFVAPILVSRTPERCICPDCGNNFPYKDQKTVCDVCGLSAVYC